MNATEINKLYELRCLKRYELEIIDFFEKLETIMNKNEYNKCTKHLEILNKEIKKKINKIEKQLEKKKLKITIDDIIFMTNF